MLAAQGNNVYLPPTLVIPGTLIITNITNAFPMAVYFTNSPVNTYIPGQLVRLFIPPSFGMQQAAGLTGQIQMIDDVSYIFYLNIDSRNFDPFITNPPNNFNPIPPSMNPAGSQNLQYNNLTAQVAFQNLNNFGN